MCNVSEKVTRLFGIAMDISDRKQIEIQLQNTNQELARATRLKDEFLANMSHELRTPLNAILGMTEGLQEEVFGAISEPQCKALHTIERSGNHLLELINDILDVAKIEAGHIELDCDSISVAYLCQSSLAFIKQQAVQKGIRLDINLQLNLPDLMVDERRIRQVLINLLTNAVKFTPEGGHITLDVKKKTTGTSNQKVEFAGHASQPDIAPQSWIQFSVIDTGIGIAAEHIPQLFQPFVQIDGALNRQYTGTGLGLALVKQIVEFHGGQVGVISELGVGSCFSFELPCPPGSPVLCHLPPAPSAPSLEQNPSLGDTTSYPPPLILLAEDNEANISTISSYLRAKGYRILLGKTGQEAIALAAQHRPNLILMDIQMPGMDGLEALKQIRLNPELITIPIIALTALAMTGDRELCLAAGATDYIAKPIKLKQLATTIQQLLDV